MNERRSHALPVSETVSHIRFTPSRSSSVASGLLGYLRFRLAGLFHVDSVALRRTRDGRLTLTFPSRTSPGGKSHPYVHPIDNATRAEIERFVVNALRERGVCPLADAAESQL